MLEEVNWVLVASSSALAAVLSLLTSVSTNLPEAPYDTGRNHVEEE